MKDRHPLVRYYYRILRFLLVWRNIPHRPIASWQVAGFFSDAIDGMSHEEWMELTKVFRKDG